MIKLTITCMLKLAQIDTYNEGCDPDTTVTDCISHGFTATAETKEEAQRKLISSCAEYIGTTEGEIQYFEDEPNRFDLSVTECIEDSPASDMEIELWKRGRCVLWLCTYSFYVLQVSDFNLIQD